MSDIFISYAREDREIAQRLARTLESHGWSVWSDARLDAGEVWDEVIERELRAARCVIVLWSKISIQRNWVRGEAEEGLRRRILVPVRIENIEPPLPFGAIQTVDLINWKGHLAHPGFRQLVASFANLLQKATPPLLSVPRNGDLHEWHWWRKLRHRRRAWDAPDFDRVLAPDSLPTALAAAVALRHRNEALMRSSEKSAARRHETESFDRGLPPPWPPEAAPLGSILLKVIIYSTIAALTVIGLEALGLKILPFLNMTRKENTESDSDGDGVEETCSVDCSVFAPPAISVSQWMMVQIFLYLTDIADTVEEVARSFDTTAALRGFSSLSLRLKNGARVGFELQVPDLSVSDDGLGEISWHNTVTGVQFLVSAPERCKPGPRHATLRIFVEGVPAGRIHFLISVEKKTSRDQPEPRGDAARNYRKAFISYASEDRVEVLKRVQTLSALRIDFFQDLLDLEPGERWEKALYLHLDQSDLFLLFWSSRARGSDWVGKEIAYALERQKRDRDDEPDIVPVIIEGPPPPPPPKELAHLHFNDRLIYFMRGSGGNDLGEQQNL